ncbi:MAG TPA: DUF4349 domain-containing protein [Clostridiales bacterium]|jgi:hypothetical protein|nr:DUF4349 domain-containing protein [Clostridiales bacterium]
MKKRLFIILLIVVLLISFGCASSHEAPNSADQGSDRGQNTYDDSTEVVSLSSRKVIRNGSMDIEADDVVAAYSDILNYANRNGGYEFKHTRTERNGYTYISAQIKIKSDKLDALMGHIGSVAVIINSSTTSDDITDEYYDVQLRLEAKKKALEKYYEFLEKAHSLDETLKLQAEINSLTEEIEVLEGKLKLWDSQVNESVLNLTISQSSDPSKPKKKVDWKALSWRDMVILIKNGFISVSNVIIAILQWLLIIIIAASPLIIIALIVYYIIRKKRKDKKKKENEGKEENNE